MFISKKFSMSLQKKFSTKKLIKKLTKILKKNKKKKVQYLNTLEEQKQEKVKIKEKSLKKKGILSK